MYASLDDPSYDLIPSAVNKSVQIKPYLLKREYKVERTKRSLNECYVSMSGDIVADRKFINLTTLHDVYILDGSTNSRVFSSSRGGFSHVHEFRIITSISPHSELKAYSAPGSSLSSKFLRETVEFIIAEETLRDHPVYIPELNIKVVAGSAVYTETVPDIIKEMNIYREYVQQQAQEYYDRPAYAPYVLLPFSYRGSKEFYLSINDTICLLPILIVDDTIVSTPRFVLKWRDGADKILKDIDVEIDVIKLLKNPEIQIGEKTCLLSTNKQILQSILDDRLASKSHQDIMTGHLKNQIQELTQSKRLLEEEIIRLKADREIAKYYSDKIYEDRVRESKERMIEKKDMSETIKIAGAAIGGVVALAGLLYKIIQMTHTK